MFSEGIFPIGDGLLDIDEERLKGLLVPEDINEIYEVEQTPFARGKFAAVRRAIHKNSGVHFAAKFLKRRRRAQSSDKEIKHEIAVLMLCNDADNIVKLNAVHESRSDTALLLDLATGGELQTFLDNEECLNEAQARICMREVLKALQFLHKRSIVHLDLKPQNILLSGERIEDGLKLCDFGISRVVTEGTNVREIVGTPDYVAPEVLQYEPLSLATDIWSVGVLTYVLLSGFSPFGGETKQETFLNISQCALTFPDKLFGGVSSAAIDFIRKALRIKPGDRMTAAGCLEHIWLKDECSIDRHIFNSKHSNKQQLEHDDEDVDDDDDLVDDDEVEDSSDDHAATVEVDADVVADQQQQVVDLSHNGSSIAEDHHEVVVEEIGNVHDNDKPQAISVDNSEEEEEIDTTNNHTNQATTTNNTTYQKYNNTNGHTNGYNNTTSSSTINSNTSISSNGHARNYLNGQINGHANVMSNGHGSSPNGYSKISNGVTTMSSSLKSSPKSMTTTTTINNHQVHPTTKTTVVHNVPAATKAITIPLSNVQQQQHFTTTTSTTTPPDQQQQQQQFLHIPARRQSSDSNKENTFLTTKKISPSTNSSSSNSMDFAVTSNGIKKPHLTVTQQANTTTTATILINPTATMGNSSSNIVATITLPPNAAIAAACNNSNTYSATVTTASPVTLNVVNNTNIASTTTNGTNNNNSHHNSFFPDAPTTPKVIRKAPNSDTSPTSVKALVKKFQLEGGEQPMNPPEFATNGGCGSGGVGNGIKPATTTITSPTTMKTNETKTKFINGRPSLQNNPTNQHSSTAISLRRASEPITAIHNGKKLSSTTATSATTGPVSVPPPLLASSNNLKTQCVYCNSCNAVTNAAGVTTITANNGCRHPSSTQGAVAVSGSASSTLHKNGVASPFSHSTKSLINGGSSSNGSLTSSSSNATNSSTTSSNALLFAGSNNTSQHYHSHLHQHHQHHAHHHHNHSLHHHGVVGKSAGAATNGLSLDQGIIC